jgi:hypothetical protein
MFGGMCVLWAMLSSKQTTNKQLREQSKKGDGWHRSEG